MKIFLIDQSHNFQRLLNELAKKPVMPFDKAKLNHKVSTVALKTNKPFETLNLDFLFNYEIFPFTIMTFSTQWQLEKRNMKIGDNILQQTFIPPTKILSQKIVFGVRINRIIDQPGKKGFSYETLQGHVEKGESSFTVEKSAPGLIFKIETYSEPGNLLTKLIGPIFSVPYQSYCTQKALMNVKRQLE